MASKVIMKMMGPSGRLKYDLLKKCADQNKHGAFSGQFTYPILVGMALFEGEMETRVGKNMTMAFSMEDIARQMQKGQEEAQDDSDPSGLQRAIYPLIKQDFSVTPSNVFSIGRDDDNDMIMVDYTISRTHAQIKLDGGKCYVIDMGSTNGTALNGQKLEPEQPYVFQAEDELGFGRFRFRAVTGTTLYVQLRS